MARRKVSVDVRLQVYVEDHEALMPQIERALREGKMKVGILHYGGDRYVMKLEGEFDAAKRD